MDDTGRTRSTVGALDRVSDGVITLDADLQYTYVNRRATQFLDRDRDELLGEYVWDVFPEAENTALVDAFERALTEREHVTFEQYSSRLDEWFDVRIYPDEHGVTILFADVTDSRVSSRRLDRILETTPTGIAVLDDHGTIVRANRRAADLLGLERSDIEGRGYDHPDWDIWYEDGTPIPPEEHPVQTVLETGEAVTGFVHGITLPDGTDRWLSSNSAPVVDEAETVASVVVAIEDITGLKRLERLIETLQPVDEVLNEATTRETTEQEVCDLLIASEQYALAWIGEYTPGARYLKPNVWSGPKSTYVVDLSIPMTDPSEIPTPTQTAVETGEIQVVADVQSDPRFEGWRAAATEHGLKAAAVVPLGHGDRVHGVLALYTTRTDAFDERERRLLSTLGRRIGQVLHALETETLLHAESVVELTFQSTDQGSFLIDVSATLDCSLTVVETIPVGEGSLLHYVTVEGAPLSAVVELGATVPEVEELRRVRETDDGGLLEIVLTGRSLAQALVSAGAVVTTDRIVKGRAAVVCELAADRSIGDLTAELTAAFPETELVAKRERERGDSPVREATMEVLANTFETELTDRQRQALRAALYAGYFESPRRSTGSEIADALSMTQPTFSHHLRNAQRILFEHLLGEP